LPYVWGDTEKLTQVLGILLSNAVKFTNEGGSITLLASAENDMVIVSVADTGIGIAPEHQERVFRKFYQVDSSMTRRYQGTGIGLSIAKAIVEAHGGRIHLKSAPGEGSTFTVELPRAAFRPAEAVTSLAGKRVILVNAFEESLEALASALRVAGASVVPIASGFECIRCARERAPDLIVFDESARDLDVVQAVQRLRGDGATEQIPLLTLWDRPGGTPSTEELAVGELARSIVKPFTPEEFVRAAADAEAGDRTGAPLAGNIGA
jgi:CheY-like chemotaxis protein